MLKIKFEQRDELPLLNIRGKRLLVIAVLIAKQKEIDCSLYGSDPIQTLTKKSVN